MALSTDDRVEIATLYARYNTAIDTGHGDAFAACFTSDGHLDTGMGAQVGTEAIAAFGTGTHEMLPGLRHQVNNLVVDGSPAAASATGFLVGYNTDGGYSVIVTGVYADDLTKTETGWLFTKRIFTAD